MMMLMCPTRWSCLIAKHPISWIVWMTSWYNWFNDLSPQSTCEAKCLVCSMKVKIGSTAVAFKVFLVSSICFKHEGPAAATTAPTTAHCRTNQMDFLDMHFGGRVGVLLPVGSIWGLSFVTYSRMPLTWSAMHRSVWNCIPGTRTVEVPQIEYVDEEIQATNVGLTDRHKIQRRLLPDSTLHIMECLPLRHNPYSVQ